MTSVALEDDTVNLRTLFAEALFRAEVGSIQGGIVGQLTGPADACRERLVTGIAGAPMRVEQVAATRRQGDGALASIEGHGPNQPLVPQVTQIVVAGVR